MKLRGNTLVESLISLSIIGIVFVIAITILNQVYGINSSSKQTQARLLTSSWFNAFEASKKNASEKIEYQGMNFSFHVKSMDSKQSLFEVKAECFLGDKVLLKRTKILRQNERLYNP